MASAHSSQTKRMTVGDSVMLSPPPQQAMMGYAMPCTLIREVRKKSLAEAYILAVSLGWMGAHHFYLGRPGFGVLYMFTFGLFGFGYLFDLVRLPCLVNHVNAAAHDRPQGQLECQPFYLADAYLMWFPFGLIGFHHFYLRRVGWGFLYFFTFGLLGVGWIIDGLRMKVLLDDSNEEATNVEARTSLIRRHHEVYTLTLSPLGILGLQHYYLRRGGFGVFYTLTLGLFGVGWIIDWFRVYWLVKFVNKNIGQTNQKKRLDDAYMLLIPFGVLGLHHFYLRRPCWGALYIFTLGCFGIGWLIDVFRLPCLVRDYNKRGEGELLRHEAQQIPPSQDGSFLVVGSNTDPYTGGQPNIYPSIQQPQSQPYGQHHQFPYQGIHQVPQTYQDQQYPYQGQQYPYEGQQHQYQGHQHPYQGQQQPAYLPDSATGGMIQSPQPPPYSSINHQATVGVAPPPYREMPTGRSQPSAPPREEKHSQ